MEPGKPGTDTFPSDLSTKGKRKPAVSVELLE
jgi:hypothetical protein